MTLPQQPITEARNEIVYPGDPNGAMVQIVVGHTQATERAPWLRYGVTVRVHVAEDEKVVALKGRKAKVVALDTEAG